MTIASAGAVTPLAYLVVMAARSRFPEGIDIRDAIGLDELATRAGVEPASARRIVDAHLFGVMAVAASGCTVVMYSGVVFGPGDCDVERHIKAEATSYIDRQLGSEDRLRNLVASRVDIAAPRVDPVIESELSFLTHALTQDREAELSSEDVTSVLVAWWELIDELNERGAEDTIVVRRQWAVLQRRLEDWLTSHLDRIHGFDLSLESRQHRVAGAGVIDLLARVGANAIDLVADTPVVIENKAVPADSKAVEQLNRYVEAIERNSGGHAIGMLIAPTIGRTADRLAATLGFPTYTWGELGFLDFIWGIEGATPIADALEFLNEDSPWTR